MSRVSRAPSTIFLTAAVFPLMPGARLYYLMYGIVSRDFQMAAEHALVLVETCLGIAFGYPVFVTEIRPDTNEVVLGTNEDVFTNELYADHINFMSVSDIKGTMEFKAKIRYSHSGSMCKVTRVGEDRIHCEFEEPVRAVTPGQAVVLYDGDYVAGGGIIC